MTAPARLGRRSLLFGRPAIADDSSPQPVASIAQSCLAFRGIACMSCRDACPTGAIRFTLVRGGAVPRVEADSCTGCAECAATCPASAIAVAAPLAKEPAHA